MTIEQILEILENYKLRIPPTVYYDLLADVVEAEEDQEPKTGHWIDEGIYADGQSYHSFMCSKCGWHFIGNKSELLDFKYCPFCGAKMAESEKYETIYNSRME